MLKFILLIFLFPVVFPILYFAVVAAKDSIENTTATEPEYCWEPDLSEGDLSRMSPKNDEMEEQRESVYPPDEELCESPCAKRIKAQNLSEDDFTPDDADVITDEEYLEFIREQEDIEQENEGTRDAEEQYQKAARAVFL